MYRKSLLIILFFIALSLSSCNWIKRIFDLPTSEEIAVAKYRAREDSIAQANFTKEQEAWRSRDSDMDMDIPIDIDNVVVPADGYRDEHAGATGSGTYHTQTQTQGQASAHTLVGTNRFHVIVGSFRDPQNAQKMMKKLSDQGFKPAQFYLRNGYVAVSAGSFTNIEEARTSGRHMRETSALCPYDFWVYDVNRGLHQ